jgi:hypothetical protein
MQRANAAKSARTDVVLAAAARRHGCSRCMLVGTDVSVRRMFALVRQYSKLVTSKLVMGCDDPTWDCEINVNVRIFALCLSLSALARRPTETRSIVPSLASRV